MMWALIVANVILLWLFAGVARVIALMGQKSRGPEMWYDQFLMAPLMVVIWIAERFEK